MTTPAPFLSAMDAGILVLEGVAAALIVGGAVWAIWNLARWRDPSRARHAMSHMLLLALDFTIGADILKGVSAPADLTAAGVLAVVVVIRIMLTFTLQREVRQKDEDRR